MKSNILLIAAIIGIGFTSCKKGPAGPEGPQGPKGETGTPGAGGKTWTYVFEDQQITPTLNEGWDEGSGAHTWSGTKDYNPEKYKGSVDNGVILVYFRMSEDAGWQLGNLTTSRMEENGSVSTNVFMPVLLQDKLQIVGRTRSVFDEGAYLKDSKFDVKVVVIESASVTTN